MLCGEAMKKKKKWTQSIQREDAEKKERWKEESVQKKGTWQKRGFFLIIL